VNAIVLNPGPSLARYQPRPADLVVGVNRAALLFDVDAWACCDLPAIETWHEEVIGSPTLIASQETLDNLRDRQIRWRGREIDRKKMLDFCPHVIDWVMFSSTTALVFAAWTGAERIDVYGADWHGTLDWDGTAAGKNRSADRWSLERGIFGVITGWLRERRVEVIRHLPPMA
jgi:hypothetical protein